MPKVKLSKVDTGYEWRAWPRTPAWAIIKDAASGEYSVRDEKRGFKFYAHTLKEIREALPEADAVARDEKRERPEWLYKTEERIEADAKARPEAEKLAAADKTIVEGLEAHCAVAKSSHDKLVQELKEGTPAQAPSVVRWAGEAVVDGYVSGYCARMLGAETPERRKAMILHRHFRTKQELLCGDYYSADSTGHLHRAVANLERQAVHRFLKILDNYLRVYHDEYVSDVPKPTLEFV